MNFENELTNFFKDYQMVGSTVIVADKDKIINHLCYGYQSLPSEQNILTSLDTIYRIASISKVIVAIVVMMYVEEGKIDLDKDISEYLGFTIRNPKYPSIPITTKMIMTQTSSISDNGEKHKGYDGVNQIDDYVTLEQLFMDSPYYSNKIFSNYAPGTNFEYSNLGCGILACLVERVSKERFTDVVVSRLLKPLGINSGFRLEDIEDKSMIAGHYIYHDGFKLYCDADKFQAVQSPKYQIGNNFRGVAGGLYISGRNLTKIMQMLINQGKLNGVAILKPSTVSLMEEVHWRGQPIDPTYKAKGLQMIIMEQFTNDPLYGHFGNAYGLRSFMLYSRKKQKGIIFLCNGANFITDEEHMTILQENLIKWLVRNTDF